MTEHQYTLRDKEQNIIVAHVSAGVEYLYIDGVDMNELRLPRDADALRLIAQLIPELLKTERGGMVLCDPMP